MAKTSRIHPADLVGFSRVAIDAILGLTGLIETLRLNIAGSSGIHSSTVDQLTSLRSIPNLAVFRPADATKTVEAWRAALNRRHAPSALVLTRQALPVFDRTRYSPAEGVLWRLHSPQRRSSGSDFDRNWLGSSPGADCTRDLGSAQR